MAGQLKPIPIPVILAAIHGNKCALTVIVTHYQNYIRTLATRSLIDEYENTHLCIDEEIRLRLESKLIHSIITGFRILSA